MPKGPIRYDARIMLLLETSMKQQLLETAGRQNVSQFIRLAIQEKLERPTA